MQIVRVLKTVLLSFAALVILAWAANVLWVVHAHAQYGGGASSGYVRYGHYYLEHYGSYTETSSAIWEAIRLHEQAIFIGYPLVLACFFCLLLGGPFRWVMGLRRGKAVAERVRAVRASGMVPARVSCGGSVGGFRLGFPAALGLELYPGGLTIRVLLEPAVAILKEELRRVKVPKGRFESGIEIDHRSPDLSPPLRLYIGRASDFAIALGRSMESTETRSG